MTIENGLDTPDVTELDRMMEAGELDERTTAYLALTRAQSIGWMLHDKAVCNYLRISTFILRKIKAAVAKLPGVRRVRYVNHKGVEYDGLLIGDHAEGEGYGIAGWYDGETYVPGLPPMLVPAPDPAQLTPTDTPPPGRAPRFSWAKRRGQKKTIQEDQVAAVEEAPAPLEDRVTMKNSEHRLNLLKIRENRPDLAPGCALIDAMLDHKHVSTSTAKAEYWQGQVWSMLGEFTPADAYQGVARVVKAGKPLDMHWIVRGVEAARRTRTEGTTP